jgi:hypothetical protein
MNSFDLSVHELTASGIYRNLPRSVLYEHANPIRQVGKLCGEWPQ